MFENDSTLTPQTLTNEANIGNCEKVAHVAKLMKLCWPMQRENKKKLVKKKELLSCDDMVFIVFFVNIFKQAYKLLGDIFLAKFL